MGAIILTLAHVIWFTVAGAIGGMWAAVIGDILILLVLTLMLWFRPGLITAGVLGLVQLGSLAYTVYLIMQVPVGDPIHRALTSHIVLRTIAIVALVMGCIRYRREAVQSDGTSMPMRQ